MMWRTRTVWLFGVTLAALGLGAGCVDGGDDDAMMTVSWQVAYVDGKVITCEDAATPVVRLDARSRQTGEAFVFDFDCGPGRGMTDAVPAGVYDITLSLHDLKGRPVAATQGSFEVRRHGTARLHPVQFRVQSWLVSWGFVLEGPGGMMRPTNCEEMGIKTVEFSAQQASEMGETFPFDCRFGLGVTSAIRTGNYLYQMRLLDAAGKTINETPVRQMVVGADTRPMVSELFPFRAQ